MKHKLLLSTILIPLLTLSLVASNFFTLSVAAQETSETEATETASPSAATTEKLRERIEKIVDEKREQIKGVLSEFDQRKRGILGSVTRISEESVTIKTTKTTEIIAISEGIDLQKDGKTVTLSDIAVGDWLVVMGLIENDTFQPKRILISSKTLRPPTPVVTLGTISAMTNTNVTVAPRNGEPSFDLTTNRNTTYQDINGDDIERAAINENTQALVVGFESDNNTKTASIIRILTVVEDDAE